MQIAHYLGNVCSTANIFTFPICCSGISQQSRIGYSTVKLVTNGRPGPPNANQYLSASLNWRIKVGDNNEGEDKSWQLEIEIIFLSNRRIKLLKENESGQEKNNNVIKFKDKNQQLWRRHWQPPLWDCQRQKNVKRRCHLFPNSPNDPESKKCPSLHLKIFFANSAHFVTNRLNHSECFSTLYLVFFFVFCVEWGL